MAGSDVKARRQSNKELYSMGNVRICFFPSAKVPFNCCYDCIVFRRRMPSFYPAEMLYCDCCTPMPQINACSARAANGALFGC